jgi:hypothetical protein
MRIVLLTMSPIKGFGMPKGPKKKFLLQSTLLNPSLSYLSQCPVSKVNLQDSRIMYHRELVS